MNKVLLWCMLLLSADLLLEAKLPTWAKSIEMKKTVSLVKLIVNNDTALLHTPNDVKDECLGAALTCYRVQVTQLKEADEKNKEQFKKFIGNLKTRPKVLSKNCTACSAYEKRGPKEFLANMETLLQQIIHLTHSKYSR